MANVEKFFGVNFLRAVLRFRIELERLPLNMSLTLINFDHDPLFPLSQQKRM